MAGRSSKGKKKQAQRRTRRRFRRLGAWIPVALVGAGAIAIAVVAIVVGGALRGSSNSNISIPERTVSTQGRTLGSENARVTVEEYADFQCPFCARAAQNIDPKIEQQYIADGRVKLVFRHMAQIGQESIWAAEAAECANEQGKFWDYHDKLFENQHGENQGAFSIDNLKRFAEELSLDTQAFNLCLDSRKDEDLVKADTQDALKRGFQGTPTYVIGDQSIQPSSFEELQKAIEGALRKNP